MFAIKGDNELQKLQAKRVREILLQPDSLSEEEDLLNKTSGEAFMILAKRQLWLSCPSAVDGKSTLTINNIFNPRKLTWLKQIDMEQQHRFIH